MDCNEILIEKIVFSGINLNYFKEFTNFIMISMVNLNSKYKANIYFSNILIENFQINLESIDLFDSFLNIDSRSFSKINIMAFLFEMNNFSISY